jgi:NitT/TauT family transport system ATP-binding protein
MNTLLELKDIEVEYAVPGKERVRLMDHVNLAVHEDELVAILGPSGSGKTSLVKVACGLNAASSGQVLFRGEPLLGVHSGIGVAFQTPGLFPWMNVHENIALGLEKLRLEEQKKSEAISWAVDRVGLEGYEEAYPRELSLGMRSRVALARALAGQPELLILDDPFAGVDVLTAESLRSELLRLWQNSDINPKAILLVTHNIPETVELANRVLVFSGTPTRVKLELHNALPYPRNPNTQDFSDKVSQIHDLITRDVMPDEGQTPGRFETRLAPLPRAEAGQIIGLLESLADHGGSFDVFDFVADTRKEYSSVLMVVNAAEMLEMVATPKDQVEITALGRQFLQSDVNGRKIMLNLQLQKMKLVRHVIEMLQRTPDRWLSKDVLLEELVLLFPSENPARQLNTFVAWVRYAELMGYSARRGQLYLDRIFVQEIGEVKEIKNPKPVLKPAASPDGAPGDAIHAEASGPEAKGEKGG